VGERDKKVRAARVTWKCGSRVLRRRVRERCSRSANSHLWYAAFEISIWRGRGREEERRRRAEAVHGSRNLLLGADHDSVSRCRTRRDCRSRRTPWDFVGPLGPLASPDAPFATASRLSHSSLACSPTFPPFPALPRPPPTPSHVDAHSRSLITFLYFAHLFKLTVFIVTASLPPVKYKCSTVVYQLF
jgi:hypothetical protein